jgi:hypothetical protein
MKTLYDLPDVRRRARPHVLSSVHFGARAPVEPFKDRLLSECFQLLQEPSRMQADAERQALRDICEFADVLDLPDGSWLLVPCSPSLIDVLAEFEAEREDLEESDWGGGDVQDEPHDEEPDLEPSLGWPEAVTTALSIVVGLLFPASIVVVTLALFGRA